MRVKIRLLAALLAVVATASCGGDSTGPDPAVPVASVAITPATLTRVIGDTAQLSATLKDAGGLVITGRTVSWTTSNPAIATVSTTGLVKSVAAGTATIAAESGGISGTSIITVTTPGSAGNPCSATNAVPILVGQTLSGTLTTTDCELDDGTFIDLYRLTLSLPVNLRITQTSTVLDAYLFLLDSAGNLLTEDDDSGGGTNAQLSGTLPAGTYYILTNNFTPGEAGAYTISVITN